MFHPERLLWPASHIGIVADLGQSVQRGAYNEKRGPEAAFCVKLRWLAQRAGGLDGQGAGCCAAGAGAGAAAGAATAAAGRLAAAGFAARGVRFLGPLRFAAWGAAAVNSTVTGFGRS
jgi:hypothetical protein